MSKNGVPSLLVYALLWLVSVELLAQAAQSPVAAVVASTASTSPVKSSLVHPLRQSHSYSFSTLASASSALTSRVPKSRYFSAYTTSSGNSRRLGGPIRSGGDRSPKGASPNLGEGSYGFPSPHLDVILAELSHQADDLALVEKGEAKNEEHAPPSAAGPSPLRLKQTYGKALTLFANDQYRRLVPNPLFQKFKATIIDSSPSFPSLLRDLKTQPRLESTLIQLIKSYYSLLDVLEQKGRISSKQSPLLGLPAHLFFHSEFRSFLRTHRSQLDFEGRKAQITHLYLFNTTSFDDNPDLSIANYLFSITRTLSHILFALGESDRSAKMGAGRSHAPGSRAGGPSSLSLQTMAIMKCIVSKVQMDLTWLSYNHHVVTEVSVENRAGLLWMKMEAPDLSYIEAVRTLPTYAARSKMMDSSHQGAPERLIYMMRELVSRRRLFSILVGATSLLNDVIEFTLPSTIAQAFRGDPLMSSGEEIVDYVLRVTSSSSDDSLPAESSASNVFVRSTMLKQLVDLSIGLETGPLKARKFIHGVMSDDANIIDPSVQVNRLDLNSASIGQRCAIGIVLQLIEMLSEELAQTKDQLSAGLTFLLTSYIQQSIKDVRDLRLLIQAKSLTHHTELELCHQIRDVFLAALHLL